MTKISFIFVIWVWPCVVYGQLPFSNYDYHSYYIPYTSTFVNQPIMQTNDRTEVHLGGNDDVTPNTKNAILDFAILSRIQQLEVTIAGFTSDLKAMNNQLDNKAERQALYITNQKVLALSNDVNAIKSPSSINKMPTSCGDLKDIGFVKSGIYSVIDNSKVENVYCDFTKPSDAGLQKLIGYVNVKTTPVYFYAQRTGFYSTTGTALPFDDVKINIGNAMDTSSGIFNVPTPGKYFFAYTGLCSDKDTKIQLQNQTGAVTWTAIGESHCTPYNALAIQATLQLDEDDEVQIYLLEGTIHDGDGNHFSNFFGWLLEEDLVL